MFYDPVEPAAELFVPGGEHRPKVRGRTLGERHGSSASTGGDDGRRRRWPLSCREPAQRIVEKSLAFVR